MSQDSLERAMVGWFEADALARAPAGLAHDVVDATGRRRPYPPLRARIGSKWTSGRGRAIPRLPWRWIGAIAVGGALLGGSALLLGSRPAPAQATVVAFTRDGDLYVGDPASGQTELVVDGAVANSNPLLSPDGRRIAFYRPEAPGWQAEFPSDRRCCLYVVNSDGSDLHIVRGPADFLRLGQIAWTPDGQLLFVIHDRTSSATGSEDGAPSLVDAAAALAERQLSPPLFTAPGGPYFGTSSGSAPMFQPPDGDLVLSNTDRYPARSKSFSVWDAGFQHASRLEPSSAELDFATYGIGEPQWSPDGGRILFEGWAYNHPKLFVMDADGSHVHLVGDNLMAGKWSPDGSQIAAYGGGDTTIVIVDAASLRRRDLVVPGCRQVGVDPCNRDRFIAGSWTPDSGGLALLEFGSGRLKVVAVESGAVTELPWAIDEFSWGPIAAGGR